MEDSGWTPDVRAHVFEAIEGVRRETLIILNERDRRYTERSSQQDKAVVDALAAAEKAVNAALVAADKAVEKEQANAEKWRNSANEWRDAMNDRETRFLGKDEAALMVQGVEARVTKLERSSDLLAGRAGGISQGADEKVQVSIQRTNTAMAFLFGLSLLVSVVATVLALVH